MSEVPGEKVFWGNSGNESGDASLRPVVQNVVVEAAKAFGSFGVHPQTPKRLARSATK